LAGRDEGEVLPAPTIGTAPPTCGDTARVAQTNATPGGAELATGAAHRLQDDVPGNHDLS
jgi:hypothetical protein